MPNRPPLPPLAAIRVFEAAARLGGFTRAGEELAMTSGVGQLSDQAARGAAGTAAVPAPVAPGHADRDRPPPVGGGHRGIRHAAQCLRCRPRRGRRRAHDQRRALFRHDLAGAPARWLPACPPDPCGSATDVQRPRDFARDVLVRPFDLVGDEGHAYWLAYPEARRRVPKIWAWRDWLLAAIGRSALAEHHSPPGCSR